MMPPREKLGEAQIEILRFIQDNAPASVRMVAEYLAAKRGLTRTTALNSMERLREKGYLKRDQLNGVYHYSPSQPKPAMLRDLVRDFVAKSLGGSLEPFVAYLAEEANLTDAERANLEERINQLRDDSSGPSSRAPKNTEETSK
jgi:predicted transcriptional regulator